MTSPEAARVVGLVQQLDQAERVVRQAEAALSRATMGLAQLGPDLRIFAVNDAFVRIVGARGRGEVLGQPCLDRFSDPVEASRCAALIQNQAEATGEVAWRRDDGSAGFVRYAASPMFDLAGKPVCTVLQVVDLTPWREAGRRALEERVLLQEMIDASPDWIFAKDAQHRFTLVNAAMANALGRRPHEVLGRLDTDFFPVEACQQYRAENRRVLRGETLRNTDNVAPVPDGSVRVFDTVKAPRRDADGVVTGVMVFARDVTEMRRSAAQLREAEARFRRVVEHIAEALIVDDAAGRITYANQRFFEMFGLSPGRVEELSLEDYVAPAWRASLRERRDRRLAGESVPTSFEYEGLRADGSTLWLHVEVALVLDDHGRPIGTQSAIRDITARRRAETELRRAHDEIHAILLAFPDSIFRVDTAGNVHDVGSVPGEPPRLLDHPCLADPSVGGGLTHHCREAAAVARASGSVVHVELDRGSKNLEARFVPTPKGDVLVVVRDITERRQAERALREREGELLLAQRFSAVGRLAGGLAHDFNNLLAVVLGFGEVLRDQLADRPRAAELQAKVLAAGRQAGELTRRLLAFAQSGQGSPEALDVDAEICTLAEVLQRAVPEEVELRFELAGGERALWLDRGHLGQLVLNLVTDAAERSGSGGVIVVKTVSHDDGLTLAVVEAAGLGPVYPGKSPHAADDARVRRGTLGAGVGLAIAQGLADQAGGVVRVEGEGRAGRVEIRFFHRAVCETRAPLPASARGSGERVVLMEPDTELREALAAVLRAAGYDLRLASSGADLLDLVARYHPELVVAALDDAAVPWAAPIAQGSAPVVWLTPIGATPTSARGRRLEKPFSAGEVLGVMRLCLEPTTP